MKQRNREIRFFGVEEVSRIGNCSRQNILKLFLGKRIHLHQQRRQPVRQPKRVSKYFELDSLHSGKLPLLQKSHQLDSAIVKTVVLSLQ